MIFRRQQPVRHSAATAFEWHRRQGAIDRLLPPWQKVHVVESTGGIDEPGSEVTLEMAVGPLRKRVRARHIDFQEGKSFSDEMVGGPFARWVHVHAVESEGDTARLVDTIDLELPLGPVGRLGEPVARRELERMFEFRRTRVAADLDRHAQFAEQPRLRVGITGQSGLIGTQLAAYLRTGGHEVIPFVRRRAAENEIAWDPAAGVLDPSDLEGLDAIEHLLHSNLDGPVNVVAPTPVRQREFARTVGRVLRRPAFLPLPAPVVGAMFGEMGREVLLASQRVQPTKLEQDGFTYLQPDLEESLRTMLGRTRTTRRA